MQTYNSVEKLASSVTISRDSVFRELRGETDYTTIALKTDRSR